MSPWRRRAERLAAALPRSRLHPAAAAWAERRPAREGWAVAFSGGADSLALLLLLWALWPARRRRLRALHFDHRLRGRASRADAAFCARVCRGLGVPLTAGAWARPDAAAGEAGARAARFDFFRREMRRRGLRALWLGHQQDDIAESMLMRLARGSGAAGLAAPRPLQAGPDGARIRPLLGLKKAELAAALRAAGAPWREDETNAGDAFLRNRIRRRVLPAWRRASAGRDALGGAALARELLEEDDDALEAWAAAAARFGARGELPLARVRGLPRAVLRRILRRWLDRHGRSPHLSRPGFELLLAALQRGRESCQSLGPGGFAVIRAGCLRFSRGNR
ncbi:MAG TPA: tRNA lysidine(34) synthetase TilS [Opitutaceae bacterium]|nr:tRNA lysidine(34) synthetase TilS [Opitutaceae bacterium]